MSRDEHSAGAGTGEAAAAPPRDVLDIDGQEFQLRTAEAISEADTSCYTDTVRVHPQHPLLERMTNKK
jgi:hypothetical protein